MTTRDDLEAVVWKALRLTRRGLAGTTDHRADVRAVDAILAAADEYGLAAYGITAERRAAILAGPRPGQLRAVHLAVPCPHEHAECNTTPRACNSMCWLTQDVLTTTVAADVTCLRCRRSPAWLQAVAA